MMRKTELNTLNYRLIVEPRVLRDDPKAEVDLNTALYGWDRRQCLNYRGVHYLECPSIIVVEIKRKKT